VNFFQARDLKSDIAVPALMQWPHGVQALPRGMRPYDTASLFDDPAIVRQKIGQITTKPQSGSVSTSLLGQSADPVLAGAHRIL
jgi:hypothetical protein